MKRTVNSTGKKLNVDPVHLDAYNTGYNLGIDETKFKSVFDRIQGIDSKYPVITVPSISPSQIGDYYGHPEIAIQGHCPVPWSQVNINYNGDVHFCADYPDYLLGNIQEERFFKIFNNAKAVKFRQELKKAENGIFPGCLRCYQNMLFGRPIRKEK